MWECMNRLRASLMEHPEGICLNFPKRKRYQRQQSSGSGRIARDVWVACKAALIKVFWCVFLISVVFFSSGEISCNKLKVDVDLYIRTK